MVRQESALGNIEISTAAMASIVGVIATSCYGVVGMVPSGNKQKLFQLFNKKNNIDKGITVIGNSDSISVELHIIVSYGMNINAIAKSIVNKVRFTVKEATGINVDKVTVKVDGIQE